jgi:hypothetical protein
VGVKPNEWNLCHLITSEIIYVLYHFVNEVVNHF